MNSELAVKQNGMISNFGELEKAAGAMAASGFFKDATQAAQAIVKIMAGSEMGFGAFASMSGIHIIQGKPAIGANLIAAAVKRNGRYDYRVTRLDETGCEITFFQGTQEIGKSSFTEADAKKAGLLTNPTWSKFARNMYFSRAMSNGAKWFCPDVFSAPIYTPEELGANVDGDGNVIESTFTEVKPVSQPAPVKKVSLAESEDIVDYVNAVVKSDAPIEFTTVKTDEGVLYSDLQLADLVNRFNSLDKVLKKNGLTPEEKAEKTLKRDAAKHWINVKREQNQ